METVLEADGEFLLAFLAAAIIFSHWAGFMAMGFSTMT